MQPSMSADIDSRQSALIPMYLLHALTPVKIHIDIASSAGRHLLGHCLIYHPRRV